MVFNGKDLAERIESDLMKSGKLKGKSLTIIQCDGNNKESKYVELKRKEGERLGVEVAVEILGKKDEVTGAIKKVVTDAILVQLPVRGATKKETEEMLAAIQEGKDVDGLNPKSKFVPAAVLAVEKVMTEAMKAGAFEFDIYLRVGVVGAKGMVGSRLVKRLRDLGYVVAEFDLGDDLVGLSDCDIVVSAVGKEALIKPDMVAAKVVAIDLGYPKGDFDLAVIQKAVFFTPVPGGVGPVTVVCLFENMALI